MYGWWLTLFEIRLELENWNPWNLWYPKCNVQKITNEIILSTSCPFRGEIYIKELVALHRHFRANKVKVEKMIHRENCVERLALWRLLPEKKKVVHQAEDCAELLALRRRFQPPQGLAQLDPFHHKGAFAGWPRFAKLSRSLGYEPVSFLLGPVARRYGMP